MAARTNGMLDEQQRERALEMMRDFLNSPPGPERKSAVQLDEELDRSRQNLIEQQLKPLLRSYLRGGVGLPEFKSQIDGINKRQNHWGFKGVKGQMFFNMLVNTSADLAQCDAELKAALPVPANEEAASSRIRTFASFVRRIGEEHLERGGPAAGKPKTGSIPFFLSYFWQIQEPEIWPVYYTNSVQVTEDANLWRPVQDLAEDYITFKLLYEELAELFTQASGRLFRLYDVEHVFWFATNPPDRGADDAGDKPKPEPQLVLSPPLLQLGTKLPDSFVPPIIAILPQMAVNAPDLVKAAGASGTSLERAFEKSVNAALTILGYETQLLGQGQGRVPDGRAVDADNSYAILWDAKVRGNGYSMGTDDRTIREYITSQSRQLKRSKSLRNIYYLVVSSRFQDDYDDTIRMLKMDTDVNEVCLLEAEALIEMVDAKLRAPREVTLGPDGLQRLFCTSGIISVDDVRQMFA